MKYKVALFVLDFIYADAASFKVCYKANNLKGK